MKNKITIIGSGYVGLVTGTCLSDFGKEVICVDNNKEKIDNLNKGILPIYEPGLEAMIERNTYYKRLTFTTDIKYAIENTQVIFIAVGTPPAEDGSADMKYVELVARSIAKYMNGYKVIVNKSTVPVGTAKQVRQYINEELEKRKISYDFDIISNPEFLREGSAIRDFTHPDKIVIGYETEKAKEAMKEVYRPLYLNEVPFIFTNIETSEMIKYANNAFLAVKITFINEIANLCEKVGANVQDIAKAIGKDGRISPKFLHAGPGYGGSCFPKDTNAIVSKGKEHGIQLSIIENAISANEKQKLLMADKIKSALKDLNGKTIGVLGLTFKPETDDMRDAPSITIINELVKNGAKIKAYDPKGTREAIWRLENIKESIQYCKDSYEVMDNSDCIVLITEWHEFRSLDLDKAKELLKQPIFFDLRNVYEKKEVEQKGFQYYGVGV